MKKIFSYITVLCAALLIAGCSDFLDKEPLDQRIDTNFFKTKSDAMEALVSVYDALQWNSLQGFHPADMFLDVASDDAYAGGASSSDVPNIQQIDNHAILTTNNEVQGLYRKYFIGIQRANALLQKIDSVDADEAFKTRVTAECKFLRAYFYLDLVRFYENVPLITKTLVVSESFQPQATPAISARQYQEPRPTRRPGNGAPSGHTPSCAAHRSWDPSPAPTESLHPDHPPKGGQDSWSRPDCPGT